MKLKVNDKVLIKLKEGKSSCSCAIDETCGFYNQIGRIQNIDDKGLIHVVNMNDGKGSLGCSAFSEKDLKLFTDADKLRVGDKIKVISKSVKGCTEYRQVKENTLAHIRSIYGDPYSGIDDDDNCFVVCPQGDGGDYFLPKDLILVEKDNELKVGDKVRISIPRNKQGWECDGMTGKITLIKELKGGVHLPVQVVLDKQPEGWDDVDGSFKEEEIERVE